MITKNRNPYFLNNRHSRCVTVCQSYGVSIIAAKIWIWYDSTRNLKIYYPFEVLGQEEIWWLTVIHYLEFREKFIHQSDLQIESSKKSFYPLFSSSFENFYTLLLLFIIFFSLIPLFWNIYRTW